MLMNFSKIILTMKTTLISILLLSVFFFQKKTNTLTKSSKYLKMGMTHNTKFKIYSKTNTFFITLLKNLAMLSLIPLFMKIFLGSPDMVMSFKNWFTKNSFKMKLEFHFDLKFKTFFSVALLVSWSIMEFSYYYMGNDPAPKKFFRLLMIFLLKMIMLTSTKNIFLLFMGWEGVGFLSFLLMSWWFTRTKAKNSAIQAVMYNRIGDMGILLFFSLSVTTFNSWSLSEMSILKTKKMEPQNLLLMGALIAAAGKSAQFGLHPWLPAAMEGPTPVSALLHSSTMVVAGMFLLVRLSPLYENMATFKSWCLILGSLTATFAATTAISQHDMKKIVAYSTTSQLGLMMVAMGLNQPKMALFHICTHAFFKAMLFLSSGSIIHSLKDEQDIRKMGGLHLLLPKTSTCIILGSLALSGIPFLAGFYSKDLILEVSLTKFSNFTGVMLSFVATLLTAVYSVRMIYFCFLVPPSFTSLSPTSEENQNMTKALNRLALGTIISGWLLSSFMFLKNSITINILLKTLALMVTMIGMTYAVSILKKLSSQMMPANILNSNHFTTKQWFYENISHILLLLFSFLTSLFLSTRKIDRGWSEKLGAQGMGHLTASASQKYQLSQTGYIKQYLLFSCLTFMTMFILVVTFA